MRVLIINKFLYPNGGSETYIFKLGEALEQHGHEVQYFGMSSISFLKIVLHSFAQNNDLVRIFRSIFFALVDKLRTKS